MAAGNEDVMAQDRTALLVQEAPAPRDLTANLRRTAQLLATADTDLVVCPELFLSSYQTEGIAELALRRDAPELAALAAACAEHGTALVTGYIESAGGRFFNTVLAIDSDGRVAGHYRKTHLFGAEAQAFAAGEELAIVRLLGRRVGLLNCFDVEFPEPARALALAGAELLVVIAANMHPYAEEHRVPARARALENRLPLLYANQVGAGAGHVFCGGSCAIGSGGVVLAELPGEAAGLLRAAVAASAPVPEQLNTLALRRPDLPVRDDARG